MPLQGVIDLHQSMIRAETPQQRWAVAQKSFQNLGVEWVTAGTAPRVKLDAVQVRTNLPEGVMADYISARLPIDDPWMQHSAASNIPDVLNFEYAKDTILTQHARKLRDVFDGHGLRQICLLPTYGGDRPGALVLYAKGKEEAEHLRIPQQLKYIQVMASIISAYWRPEDATTENYLPALGQYSFGKLLSQRECEALLWLANGHHSARIAEKMGIEPVTVAKHLSLARQKLGAKSREQALAFAIKYRLIRP